jgi:aspartyl-tRNA(Asn)/glutamyl-tRNA(Gln) amidotransferase subunit C
MSISEHDVLRIAKLARIELTPEQRAQSQTELTGILGLIEKLQSVDTSGIVPMAHPLEAHQDIHLRLRDDVAADTATEAGRDTLMQNAPARHDGLFLVPTVIE